jgi:hypothetical protein
VSTLTAYKRGPSADRGGIDAALSNPTLVTSQISLQSNVTTSLPLLIRPWSQGWEQKFNVGSIIFVHKSGEDKRMSTGLDIPCLNYILQQANRSVGRQNYNLENNDMYDAIPQETEDHKNFELTMGNFKFGFFGVIRNDMMADSTLQKLYNLDVFGRTMVANIFSEQKLKRSDKVGLAVVLMNTDKAYSFFEQPDGSRIPNIVTGSYSLQVIGTKDGLLCGYSDKPSKDNPHGKNNVGDDQTVVRILRMIPLGVVSHAVAKVPSLGQIKAALRNQDKFTNLPRIEVLLN